MMLFDNRKTQVIEVEVTQEDIERAMAVVPTTIWRSQHCAVSQALIRHFGGHWATTHDDVTRFSGDGRVMESYDHDGWDLVYAFDHGRAVPGTIRLTRVAE